MTKPAPSVYASRSSALPDHQTSDKRPLFNLINIQYIGITFAIHKQLHLNATFSFWSPIRIVAIEPSYLCVVTGSFQSNRALCVTGGCVQFNA